MKRLCVKSTGKDTRGIPEPPERRDVNANDCAALSNNKARSVKPNARTLSEMQKVTVTLADKCEDMEEKLRELRASMSKEKEERRQSRQFKWTYGKSGYLNTTSQINSSKKEKLQKSHQQLLSGKGKVTVLKGELLAALPQPPPLPPTVLSTGHRTAGKSRLKGLVCGQCEVKTTGVACVECSENYCIGCFTKFHQKGAMKLHKMMPVQTNLQTHVSMRDVASCFQKPINPSFHTGSSSNPNLSPSSTPGSNPTTTPNTITRQEDESPDRGREAEDKHVTLKFHRSQVLVLNHGEEEKVVMITDGKKRSPSNLIRGEYNEEESARSFQEALREWRGEMSDGGADFLTVDATAITPRPVSATATQVDLPPDRETQGRRRKGEERVPGKVEFSESSLTYMDQLRLKKHRRTPVEIDRSLLMFDANLKSPPSTHKEETASDLTDEEEDFHRYFSSLFNVHVTREMPEAEISQPETCLVIEVLDETCRDQKGAFAAEQKTKNNQKVLMGEQITWKGRTLLPDYESSGVRKSSSDPTQPPRQPTAPVQPKTQKLLSSEPQAPQAQCLVKSLPSKSEPSACPTTESSGSSKAPIKTPPPKSLRSIGSPTIHISKANHGSGQFLSSLPHSQSDIPKSPHPAIPFSADVLALASNKSAVPEEHLSHSPSISFSLRSTFTVSPLSFTESSLLPKVYHSALLQKSSDLSLLPEDSYSPQLFADPASPPKLWDSPRSKVTSPHQPQHFPNDQELRLSNAQSKMPLSPGTDSTHPLLKSLEPCDSRQGPLPYKSPAIFSSKSSQFSDGPPEEYFPYSSTTRYKSAEPEAGDHISTVWHQDADCILIPSANLLNVNQNATFAGKMEKEETQSIDSEDEMSSDSLNLGPYEEDSSDEETQMQGYVMRDTPREEQSYPHLSETETNPLTDDQKGLSELSMVMDNPSAGSGSQHFCDLNGLLPLGLDMTAGHSDTPEHACCDPIQASQASLHDSDPTGLQSCRSGRSLRRSPEEQLVFRAMKDSNTEPTRVHSHSPRREISRNERGTSAPRTLSRAAQEIMEICGVDQTGCEDPDLDTDTTNTLLGLETELRLMAKGAGSLAFRIGKNGDQGQRGNHCLTRSKSSMDQDEEDAANSDRQCVLLLP